VRKLFNFFLSSEVACLFPGDVVVSLLAAAHGTLEAPRADTRPLLALATTTAVPALGRAVTVPAADLRPREVTCSPSLLTKNTL